MNKAGSTSLQSALAHYDDGVSFYPSIAGSNQPNHSSAFWSILKGAYGMEETPKRLQERNRELLAIPRRKHRRRVILSSEAVRRFHRGGMERVFQYFDEQFSQKKYVLYIRHPSDWAMSAFQQSLKRGTGEFTGRPLARSEQVFSRLFGRLTDRDVDFLEFSRDALIGGDVVSDFASRYDLKLAQPSSRKNESLSLNIQRCLTLLDDADPKRVPDRTDARRRAHFIGHLTKVSNHADDKIAQHFLEHAACRADIDWLARETGVRFEAYSQDISEGAHQKLDDEFAAMMRLLPADFHEALRIYIHQDLGQNCGDDHESLIICLFNLASREYNRKIGEFKGIARARAWLRV